MLIMDSVSGMAGFTLSFEMAAQTLVYRIVSKKDKMFFKPVILMGHFYSPMAPLAELLSVAGVTGNLVCRLG